MSKKNKKNRKFHRGGGKAPAPAKIEVKGFAYQKCDHPLFVKCGKHNVLIVGSQDYTTAEYGNAIAKLDVFIGLAYGFEKYAADPIVHYKDPLLERIAKMREGYKKQSAPSNIIVLEVPDYGIDNSVYLTIRDLLKENKRIGFGCAGAHGRTGWILAKLLMEFEGLDGDHAVAEVRKRLCDKAIESRSQLDDLGAMKSETRFALSTSSGTGSLWDSRDIYGGKDFKSGSVLTKDERDAAPYVTAQELAQIKADEDWDARITAIRNRNSMTLGDDASLSPSYQEWLVQHGD